MIPIEPFTSTLTNKQFAAFAIGLAVGAVGIIGTVVTAERLDAELEAKALDMWLADCAVMNRQVDDCAKAWTWELKRVYEHKASKP